MLGPVAPEHAFDVEGRRAVAFCNAHHLGGGHEQDDGAGIQKAADQPGAGDTVDLGPRARHPDGAALRIAGGELCRINQRQPGRPPGLEPAFEILRRAAFGAKPGGGTLRAPVAGLADGDGGVAAELQRQGGERPIVDPRGTGEQPWIGGEILL